MKVVVLVITMIRIRSAKTVFEIVDKHAFNVAKIDSIKIGSLDLKVRVITVLNVLELVIANLGN